MHTYIHNNSYSAQSYIKNRATVYYKGPDMHKINYVKAMLKGATIAHNTRRDASQ